MALRDSTRLIGHALNLTSQLVESDTEVSTIDLNLLDNLNTNQLLNYIKLEQGFNKLKKNASHLTQLTNEFRAYQKQLEHIEQQVETLGAVTRELDAWSKDLETRAKKM